MDDSLGAPEPDPRRPRTRFFAVPGGSGSFALRCAGLAGALAGALAGCGDDVRVIRGKGPIVRAQSSYRPFSEVSVKGHVDLRIEALPPAPGELEISSGPGTTVFLEGAQDLLEYIEVVPVDDVLRIRFRDGVQLDPLPTIKVDLGRLTDLSVMGSGDIQVTGLRRIGASGGRLQVSAAGSVDILASGEVGEVEIDHVGSGDVDFRGLRAERVTHSSAGSGDCWLWASESLHSSVAGSGDVYLLGSVPDDGLNWSSVGSAELTRWTETDRQDGRFPDGSDADSDEGSD